MLWGCKPATAHARRFGPLAVNTLAADVIRAMRAAGRYDELAAWVAPVEEAWGAGLGCRDARAAELRADLTDTAEDDAQARYRANPCEATARALLRARAAERQASLEHDRLLAERHGLTL